MPSGTVSIYVDIGSKHSQGLGSYTWFRLTKTHGTPRRGFYPSLYARWRECTSVKQVSRLIRPPQHRFRRPRRSRRHPQPASSAAAKGHICLTELPPHPVHGSRGSPLAVRQPLPRAPERTHMQRPAHAEIQITPLPWPRSPPFRGRRWPGTRRPHTNSVCDGRWVLRMWPHRLPVCEVGTGFALTGSPAWWSGFRSGPRPPRAGRLRCRPAFRFRFRPGSAPVPLAEAGTAFVFRSSMTTVCAVSAGVRRSLGPWPCWRRGLPAICSVLGRAYTVPSRSVACPTDRQAQRGLPHCGFARVAGNGAWDPFRYAWFTKTGTDGKWLSDRELRKGFNAVKWDVYPWPTDLCPHVGQKAIRHGADGLNRRGSMARPARPAGRSGTRASRSTAGRDGTCRSPSRTGVPRRAWTDHTPPSRPWTSASAGCGSGRTGLPHARRMGWP